MGCVANAGQCCFIIYLNRSVKESVKLFSFFNLTLPLVQQPLFLTGLTAQKFLVEAGACIGEVYIYVHFHKRSIPHPFSVHSAQVLHAFFTHGAQTFSTVPTHMHVSCTFPSPISSSRTFHLPSTYSSQPSPTPLHVPCTFPSPASSSNTLPSGSPTGSDAAGTRFQVWFFHALYSPRHEKAGQYNFKNEEAIE